MYIFASDAKPNEKPSNGHRTRFAAYTHTKKIILKWIFWNCAAIASPCRWQKSVPRSTKRPWSSKSGAKCSVTPIWWNGIRTDGDLPDAFIREQLRHSYLLVAAGITPKALRQEIRNQIEKAGLPEE